MNYILNGHNKNLIDITFPNLLRDHKEIIVKSLNEIFVVLLNTIFFKNEESFIKQMKLNDSRDILGFVILLLPYFDFSVRETCLKIKSLDDIFKDPNPNEKLYIQNVFKSTYYLDHDTVNYNLDDYKKYFYNNSQKIINTISKVKHKLLPNWLNIFPYKLKQFSDIKNIKPYNNLKKIFIEKKFDYTSNDLEIGYDTLYGTIVNFLYNDVYRIKWMIYDYYENDKILPSIIHICDILDLNSILVEKYNTNSIKADENRIFYKLSLERQEQLINIWKNAISNEKYLSDLTNLLLFYVRVNINQIDKIKISKRCKSFFKKNLKEESEGSDDIEENYIYQNEDNKLCIKELANNIEYADIYEYIFSCLQQFRYTWYGFMCVSGKNIVYKKGEYKKIFDEFFDDELKNVKNDDKINYKNFISLKLFYNYFKSLVHVHIISTNDDNKNDYIKGGNSWDEMENDFREKFIEKLNDDDENNISWFNIPNNLKRKPNLDKNYVVVIMTRLRLYLFKIDFIPKIIIMTLIYNGILTQFIYNPEITSKIELPDKNKDFLKYRNHIKDRLKIEEYEDSYNFLSNTAYIDIPNSCENIKNSFWYGNFGGDWVAQIQIYHHFINQRFMIITAVTGAGKSTVIPFILLYALKILNYNNNCKLVCTAPRIGPVTKNTKRISDSLGYRYEEIKEIDLESKREKKKIKKEIITYIQFQHAKENTVDNYYHPILRFITDGALYQQVKDKYLFKVDIDKSYKNLFDIILIDEAHEHNTYMDLILTMARNSLYLNNQITLGIVSATIDYDEPLYRKYFYNINDNLRFPLKLNEFNYRIITNEYNRLDSNLIDRRINVGAPYTGTNFTITEKYKKNVNEMIILKEIFKISKNDDILLFKSGTNEIKKTVNEINNNSPSHVYAIPFYKDLETKIRENVEEIADKNIRTNFFRFPKKKEITEIDNIKEEEYVKAGTYTQYVIVATNIAEASITIDSLAFVIDDGMQKTNYYDYDIRNSKLVKESIADPNRLQRKGRVGRVKPGTIYYTYLSSAKDFKSLKSKVQYKICIEDITTYVINFINNKTGEKEINQENDPSIIMDRFNITLPEYIKNQYIYKFLNVDKVFTSSYCFLLNKSFEERKYRKEDIYYSYTDSRFDIEDVIDNKGRFFIIHPDDDILIRNKNLDFINIVKNDKFLTLVKLDDNGNIILKENKPIIDKKDYINKVEVIINILKDYYILDDENKITNIGKIIQDIISEGFLIKTESILCILDIIKNYENIDYYYIIFLIIYMEGIILTLSEQIKKKLKYDNIKSDIINIINIFPKKLLDELLLYDIDAYKSNEIIKNKLENIDKEIDNKSFKILNNYGIKYKLLEEDIFNLHNIFAKYNKIKIRIEIYKDRFRLFDRYKKIIEKYPDIKDNKDKFFIDDLKIIDEYESDKTNKLYDKESINIKKNIEVNIFNSYEKMCYFAAKYYVSNIVINVPRTQFYLNYFNPNINMIYEINKRNTNVNVYYRLNYILYCSNMENSIDIITFIPSKIINKIIKDENKKINKNKTIINLEYIKENYETYDKIIKKIDIIIQYINSI